MNRKVIATVALSAALATGSGCGSSTGSTSTVTKTVTVTKADNTTKAACTLLVDELTVSESQLLKATKIYTAQLMPSYKAGLYGTSLAGIAVKIGEGTKHVDEATRAQKKANALKSACLG